MNWWTLTLGALDPAEDHGSLAKHLGIHYRASEERQSGCHVSLQGWSPRWEAPNGDSAGAVVVDRIVLAHVVDG